MISVENVSFRYPNTSSDVLKDVNLQIDDGEFVAIMGENGAGKTTLVKTFNGLLKPQNGRVIIDGTDTEHKSVAQLSKTSDSFFKIQIINYSLKQSPTNWAFHCGISDSKRKSSSEE